MALAASHAVPDIIDAPPSGAPPAISLTVTFGKLRAGEGELLDPKAAEAPPTVALAGADPKALYTLLLVRCCCCSSAKLLLRSDLGSSAAACVATQALLLCWQPLLVAAAGSPTS